MVDIGKAIQLLLQNSGRQQINYEITWTPLNISISFWD